MVTEPPEVGFAARQTGTMNTRLLPGADADDGTAKGVRDAVRLRVFKCERRNDEVGRS